MDQYSIKELYEMFQSDRFTTIELNSDAEEFLRDIYNQPAIHSYEVDGIRYEIFNPI